MAKSREKLAEIAQRHWMRPDERLAWVAGGRGHVGSTVDTMRTVPHRPIGDRPALHAPTPDWPLPSRSVGDNRFHNDEWAHDPAIWGWCHAQRPEQTAVRFADLFTVGRDQCWLLVTNHRIALVAEGEAAQPDPPARDGLLGRVRALGQTRDIPPLVTWWEAPITAIGRFTPAPLGRHVRPEWFIRLEFADGSTFDLRDDNAEQAVRTIHANT